MTKRCFPPVVDANTRILILGSLPGERSSSSPAYPSVSHAEKLAVWRQLRQLS